MMPFGHHRQSSNPTSLPPSHLIGSHVGVRSDSPVEFGISVKHIEPTAGGHHSRKNSLSHREASGSPTSAASPSPGPSTNAIAGPARRPSHPSSHHKSQSRSDFQSSTHSSSSLPPAPMGHAQTTTMHIPAPVNHPSAIAGAGLSISGSSKYTPSSRRTRSIYAESSADVQAREILPLHREPGGQELGGDSDSDISSLGDADEQLSFRTASTPVTAMQAALKSIYQDEQDKQHRLAAEHKLEIPTAIARRSPTRLTREEKDQIRKRMQSLDGDDETDTPTKNIQAAISTAATPASSHPPEDSAPSTSTATTSSATDTFLTGVDHHETQPSHDDTSHHDGTDVPPPPAESGSFFGKIQPLVPVPPVEPLPIESPPEPTPPNEEDDETLADKLAQEALQHAQNDDQPESDTLLHPPPSKKQKKKTKKEARLHRLSSLSQGKSSTRTNEAEVRAAEMEARLDAEVKSEVEKKTTIPTKWFELTSFGSGYVSGTKMRYQIKQLQEKQEYFIHELLTEEGAALITPEIIHHEWFRIPNHEKERKRAEEEEEMKFNGHYEGPITPPMHSTATDGSRLKAALAQRHQAKLDAEIGFVPDTEHDDAVTIAQKRAQAQDQWDMLVRIETKRDELKELDASGKVKFLLDPVVEPEESKRKKSNSKKNLGTSSSTSSVQPPPQPISLLQQGDLNMYTIHHLLDREVLKFHPDVLVAIREWWHSSTKLAAPRAHLIGKGEYFTILRLLYYVLVDCDVATPQPKESILAVPSEKSSAASLDLERRRAEFTATLEHDWLVDSEGGIADGLNFAQFHRSLYQLADHWTFTLDGAEYATFLRSLLNIVTESEEDEYGHLFRTWKTMPFNFDLTELGYPSRKNEMVEEHDPDWLKDMTEWPEEIEEDLNQLLQHELEIIEQAEAEEAENFPNLDEVSKALKEIGIDVHELASTKISAAVANESGIGSMTSDGLIRDVQGNIVGKQSSENAVDILAIDSDTIIGSVAVNQDQIEYELQKVAMREKAAEAEAAAAAAQATLKLAEEKKAKEQERERRRLDQEAKSQANSRAATPSKPQTPLPPQPSDLLSTPAAALSSARSSTSDLTATARAQKILMAHLQSPEDRLAEHEAIAQIASKRASQKSKLLGKNLLSSMRDAGMIGLKRREKEAKDAALAAQEAQAQVIKLQEQFAAQLAAQQSADVIAGRTKVVRAANGNMLLIKIQSKVADAILDLKTKVQAAVNLKKKLQAALPKSYGSLPKHEASKLKRKMKLMIDTNAGIAKPDGSPTGSKKKLPIPDKLHSPPTSPHSSAFLNQQKALTAKKLAEEAAAQDAENARVALEQERSAAAQHALDQKREMEELKQAKLDEIIRKLTESVRNLESEQEREVRAQAKARETQDEQMRARHERALAKLGHRSRKPSMSGSDLEGEHTGEHGRKRSHDFSNGKRPSLSDDQDGHRGGKHHASDSNASTMSAQSHGRARRRRKSATGNGGDSDYEYEDEHGNWSSKPPPLHHDHHADWVKPAGGAMSAFRSGTRRLSQSNSNTASATYLDPKTHSAFHHERHTTTLPPGGKTRDRFKDMYRVIYGDSYSTGGRVSPSAGSSSTRRHGGSTRSGENSPIHPHGGTLSHSSSKASFGIGGSKQTSLDLSPLLSDETFETEVEKLTRIRRERAALAIERQEREAAWQRKLALIRKRKEAHTRGETYIPTVEEVELDKRFVSKVRRRSKTNQSKDSTTSKHSPHTSTSSNRRGSTDSTTFGHSRKPSPHNLGETLANNLSVESPAASIIDDEEEDEAATREAMLGETEAEAKLREDEEATKAKLGEHIRREEAREKLRLYIEKQQQAEAEHEAHAKALAEAGQHAELINEDDEPPARPVSSDSDDESSTHSVKSVIVVEREVDTPDGEASRPNFSHMKTDSSLSTPAANSAAARAAAVAALRSQRIEKIQMKQTRLYVPRQTRIYKKVALKEKVILNRYDEDEEDRKREEARQLQLLRLQLKAAAALKAKNLKALARAKVLERAGTVTSVVPLAPGGIGIAPSMIVPNMSTLSVASFQLSLDPSAAAPHVARQSIFGSRAVVTHVAALQAAAEKAEAEAKAHPSTNSSPPHSPVFPRSNRGSMTSSLHQKFGFNIVSPDSLSQPSSTVVSPNRPKGIALDLSGADDVSPETSSPSHAHLTNVTVGASSTLAVPTATGVLKGGKHRFSARSASVMQVRVAASGRQTHESKSEEPISPKNQVAPPPTTDGVISIAHSLPIQGPALPRRRRTDVLTGNRNSQEFKNLVNFRAEQHSKPIVPREESPDSAATEESKPTTPATDSTAKQPTLDGKRSNPTSPRHAPTNLLSVSPIRTERGSFVRRVSVRDGEHKSPELKPTPTARRVSQQSKPTVDRSNTLEKRHAAKDAREQRVSGRKSTRQSGKGAIGVTRKETITKEVKVEEDDDSRFDLSRSNTSESENGDDGGEDSNDDVMDSPNAAKKKKSRYDFNLDEDEPTNEPSGWDVDPSTSSAAPSSPPQMSISVENVTDSPASPTNETPEQQAFLKRRALLRKSAMQEDQAEIKRMMEIQNKIKESIASNSPIKSETIEINKHQPTIITLSLDTSSQNESKPISILPAEEEAESTIGPITVQITEPELSAVESVPTQSDEALDRLKTYEAAAKAHEALLLAAKEAQLLQEQAEAEAAAENARLLAEAKAAALEAERVAADEAMRIVVEQAAIAAAQEQAEKEARRKVAAERQRKAREEAARKAVEFKQQFEEAKAKLAAQVAEKAAAAAEALAAVQVQEKIVQETAIVEPQSMPGSIPKPVKETHQRTGSVDDAHISTPPLIMTVIPPTHTNAESKLPPREPTPVKNSRTDSPPLTIAAKVEPTIDAKPIPSATIATATVPVAPTASPTSAVGTTSPPPSVTSPTARPAHAHRPSVTFDLLPQKPAKEANIEPVQYSESSSDSSTSSDDDDDESESHSTATPGSSSIPRSPIVHRMSQSADYGVLTRRPSQKDMGPWDSPSEPSPSSPTSLSRPISSAENNNTFSSNRSSVSSTGSTHALHPPLLKGGSELLLNKHGHRHVPYVPKQSFMQQAPPTKHKGKEQKRSKSIIITAAEQRKLHSKSREQTSHPSTATGNPRRASGTNQVSNQSRDSTGTSKGSPTGLSLSASQIAIDSGLGATSGRTPSPPTEHYITPSSYVVSNMNIIITPSTEINEIVQPEYDERLTKLQQHSSTTASEPKKMQPIPPPISVAAISPVADIHPSMTPEELASGAEDVIVPFIIIPTKFKSVPAPAPEAATTSPPVTSPKSGLGLPASTNRAVSLPAPSHDIVPTTGPSSGNAPPTAADWLRGFTADHPSENAIFAGKMDDKKKTEDAKKPDEKPAEPIPEAHSTPETLAPINLSRANSTNNSPNLNSLGKPKGSFFIGASRTSMQFATPVTPMTTTDGQPADIDLDALSGVVDASTAFALNIAAEKQAAIEKSREQAASESLTHDIQKLLKKSQGPTHARRASMANKIAKGNVISQKGSSALIGSTFQSTYSNTEGLSLGISEETSPQLSPTSPAPIGFVRSLSHGRTSSQESMHGEIQVKLEEIDPSGGSHGRSDSAILFSASHHGSTRKAMGDGIPLTPGESPSLFDGQTNAGANPANMVDEKEGELLSATSTSVPLKQSSRRSSMTGAAGFKSVVQGTTHQTGANNSVATGGPMGVGSSLQVHDSHGHPLPKSLGLSWPDTRERILQKKASLQQPGRELVSPPLIQRSNELGEAKLEELLGRVVAAVPIVMPSHMRHRSNVDQAEIQAQSQALLEAETPKPIDPSKEPKPNAPFGAGPYVPHSYLRPAKILTLKRNDYTSSTDTPVETASGRRRSSLFQRTQAKDATFGGTLSQKALDNLHIGLDQPTKSPKANKKKTKSEPKVEADSTAALASESTSDQPTESLKDDTGTTGEAHLISTTGDVIVDDDESTSRVPASAASTFRPSRVKPSTYNPFDQESSPQSPKSPTRSRSTSHSPRRSSPSHSPIRPVKIRSKKPFSDVRARLAAMNELELKPSITSQKKEKEKHAQVKDEAKVATPVLKEKDSGKGEKDSQVDEQVTPGKEKESSATADESTVADASSSSTAAVDTITDLPTMPEPRKKKARGRHNYSIHARTQVSLAGTLVDTRATDLEKALQTKSWVDATQTMTEELAVVEGVTHAPLTRNLSSGGGRQGGEIHQSVYAPAQLSTFLPPKPEEKSMEPSGAPHGNKFPPVPALPIDQSVGLFSQTADSKITPISRLLATGEIASGQGLASNTSHTSIPSSYAQTARSIGRPPQPKPQQPQQPQQPLTARLAPSKETIKNSNIHPSGSATPPLRPTIAFAPTPTSFTPLLPTPPITPAPDSFNPYSSYVTGGNSNSSSSYVKPFSTIRKQPPPITTGPSSFTRLYGQASRPISPIDVTPRYTFALPKERKLF